MANLPTAYASQRFGRKTLDFYAVEGEVAGADPRARADERRLQDIDGARHTVRLMENGFELEPGQTATVLRMQPGPARRSRPVAVVNHDTRAWCRTHPGAEGLLAKAGVSRTFNWAMTMALFVLAALAIIWPFLRAFLVEVDPGLFGQAPSFNVAELAAGALPALTGWSFSDVVAPISGPVGEAAPALAGIADGLVFGVGVVIAALGVYLLRSWRLFWAPVFVGVLGAVSLGYGGVAGMSGPALSGLAIAALIFLFGGVINRVRDSARLEARIAVLADHLLRQGPQDTVAQVEAEAAADATNDAEPVDALAPAAAATAASLREPGETADDAQPAAEGAPAEDAPAEPAAAKDVTDETAPDEETATEDAAEAVDAASTEDSGLPAEPEATAESADAGETEAPVDDAGATATSVEPESVAEDEPESEPAEADAATSAKDQSDNDEAGADTAEAESETDPSDAEGAVKDGAPVKADMPPAAATEASADPEAEPASGSREASAELVAANEDEGDAAPAEAPEDQAGGATAADGDTPETVAEGDVRDSAEVSTDAAPAGLDAEEAERLRNDPRYASRAIVLPPPPPMPSVAPGEGSGEAVGPRETQTLKPNRPLPDNVIPIFAAPASSEITPSAQTPEPSNEDASKDD